MAVVELDLSPYLIPSETPISKLDCKEAFKGLSDKEKRYAYHLSKASWEGALICLLQTSPESPAIFMLFQRVFSGQDMKSLRETAINGSGLTESEYNVCNNTCTVVLYSVAYLGCNIIHGNTTINQSQINLLIYVHIDYVKTIITIII